MVKLRDLEGKNLANRHKFANIFPLQIFSAYSTIFSSEGTTQGDLLAMAMYTIGTLPLISKLQGIVLQCWYTDDSATVGNILNLKWWWNVLLVLGPRYGYFPNGTKSLLVVR